MPLVSVIIPTYNRASVLQRAIRSVFVQTFRDFELIVVDDGSSDSTTDLLETFDGKLKALVQETAAFPRPGILVSNGQSGLCWRSSIPTMNGCLRSLPGRRLSSTARILILSAIRMRSGCGTAKSCHRRVSTSSKAGDSSPGRWKGVS